jgi:ATP-dependent DNA ligase
VDVPDDRQSSWLKSISAAFLHPIPGEFYLGAGSRSCKIDRPLDILERAVTPPYIEPMRLARRPEAFSHPDWLYEIKYDGFRALAYVRNGQVELVSRNGNTFKSFPELCALIPGALGVRDAVLDGEIICVDSEGKSQFNDLLFRRGQPAFTAFDLAWINGEDLRYLPLHERKAKLRAIVKPQPSSVLYVDHIEEHGEDLFQLACEHDLEGIVAKHRFGPYVMPNEETSWIKIRNRNYSQIMGRDELFNRRSGRETEAATDGWAGCALACHMAEDLLE